MKNKVMKKILMVMLSVNDADGFCQCDCICTGK